MAIRALTSTLCAFLFMVSPCFVFSFPALNKSNTTCAPCVPEDFPSFLDSIFQPSPSTFALSSRSSLQVPQC